MMRSFFLLAIVLFGAACLLHAADNLPDTKSLSSEWMPLFNGADLEGWYTFVEGHGVGNDPEKIFQIHDGMIHIYKDAVDGEAARFGYLATTSEYADYHLRFEYKWGTKRFRPRAKQRRDSGVLYHLTGKDKIWPRSLECQVMEGRTGDLVQVYTQVSSTIDPAISEPRYMEPAAGGVPITQGEADAIQRIYKSNCYEREGWNLVEVIVKGDSSVHIVNGHVVARCEKIRQPDPKCPDRWSPLTHGRILLQAEGAEVFCRNIEIKELSERNRCIANSHRGKQRELY